MTLKELRKNAGFDMYHVARKLNVTYNAVWNWEAGKNGILRKYYKPMAKLYGCTVDELAAAIKSSGGDGA